MNRYVLMILCVVLWGCDLRKSDVTYIKLTHNFSVSHPFHDTLQMFAKEVSQKSYGKIEVTIFPNSVLGPDRTVMEQLQGGVVEMMKIGSSGLEPFDPVFSVFSLPYLFDSEEQFHKVLRGELIDKINKRTAKRDHFIILTYFPTGVRSFYTRSTPIEKPEDLQGLKIRVMNSKTSIAMIQLLGGTPTPMPYGEIYTALQQGVIDGAENNPTALTIGKQGEVAKTYSFDEHVMMPDLLLISTDTWKSLTNEQQEIVKTAADNANLQYSALWKKIVADSLQEAQDKMKVKLYYPEKELFRQKVMPLYENFSKDSLEYEIIEHIRNTK